MVCVGVCRAASVLLWSGKMTVWWRWIHSVTRGRYSRSRKERSFSAPRGERGRRKQGKKTFGAHPYAPKHGNALGGAAATLSSRHWARRQCGGVISSGPSGAVREDVTAAGLTEWRQHKCGDRLIFHCWLIHYKIREKESVLASFDHVCLTSIVASELAVFIIFPVKKTELPISLCLFSLTKYERKYYESILLASAPRHCFLCVPLQPPCLPPPRRQPAVLWPALNCLSASGWQWAIWSLKGLLSH